MKSRSKTMRVAIASFSREEWLKLKEIADDRDGMHDTYEDWQADVKKVRAHLQGEGLNVFEADVNVEELLAWCVANHLPLDGSTRSRYAQEKAEQL